jgi:GNAT superfamily N-acetyltransferase
MEIRALRESDDRSGFHSGEPELDLFFQRYAGQNQFRHHIGATYLALDANRIAGFVTVAPGEMEPQTITPHLRKGLPRYPLPILRLARLAVDVSFQGKGVGAQLIHFVFRLARTMARDFGCVGIVVDAKAGVEPFYLQYGFTVLEVVLGASEARPAPVPMFLSMASLKLR